MYTGYKNFQMTEEELAKFYGDHDELLDKLEENEYGILTLDGAVIEKVKKEKNRIHMVPYQVIKNQFCGTVKPRNLEQELAIDLLNSEEPKVKLIRGVYGSGKDYLMFNSALAQLLKGKFDKIVYIRPNVTVANVPDIGYLKGDMESKLGWTISPLYDITGGAEGFDQVIQPDQFELVALPFIRGRSFRNSLIYVTEGQNTTAEVIKLIISRAGEGSEIWINGDNHQTDRRVYDSENGLSLLIDRLAGNRLFGYVYLPKSERGEVASLCELLE